jgi:hypothetical protein
VGGGGGQRESELVHTFWRESTLEREGERERKRKRVKRENERER